MFAQLMSSEECVIEEGGWSFMIIVEFIKVKIQEELLSMNIPHSP